MYAALSRVSITAIGCKHAGCCVSLRDLLCVLQECEIPIMIIECCSQEKTFVRYYALLGSRFCMLRREFQVGVRGRMYV